MELPQAPGGRLPRAVLALGLVSLLTDVASEMIVPLLPVLLAALGGSMVELGVLQGVSEGAVSLLKLVSGRLSDRQRRRKPWMVAGYGLSAVLRPLFAVVTTPLGAVLVRTGDRVGKGLRSAPRDALLAEVAAPAQRGAAFGLQRAMDHAGALVGAVCGSVLLAVGCELRTVFAAALLPGLAAVLVLLVAVPDVSHAAPPARPRPEPDDSLRRLLPLLGVVVPSAVAGSVDLLALMRAQELGLADALLPLTWAALHLARAALAAPAGRWSDRHGRGRMLGLGLAAHAVVLTGFAFAADAFWLWPLFLGLGLHAGCTEGAERGFVADLTGASRRGAAFGVYHAAHGVAAFVGPIALGWIWQAAGAEAAFLVAAGAALVGCAWLALFVAAPPAGDRVTGS